MAPAVPTSIGCRNMDTSLLTPERQHKREWRIHSKESSSSSSEISSFGSDINQSRTRFTADLGVRMSCHHKVPSGIRKNHPVLVGSLEFQNTSNEK